MDFWPGLDIEVTVAMIGIGGILVAAVLSSAGYLYRARTDMKRSARIVLYSLLEIRHALSLSLVDPVEATEKYLEYYVGRVKGKGIELSKEEMHAVMYPLVHDYFAQMVSSMKTDIQERLLESFEKALMEFAAVNPVLAYQLRGKEKLESLVVVSNAHHNRLNEEVIETIDVEWVKSVLTDCAEEFKSDTFHALTKQLDDDILILARHCGRRDLKMCKAVCAKSINERNKYDFSEIDEWIDKLFSRLVDAARKQQEIQTAGNGLSSYKG